MGNGFPIPPCPDPAKFVLVQTKEGNYWRRKRGSGEKKAILNHAFQLSNSAMDVTAPAAKRIVNKLRPYLEGLATGRVTVNISARLRTQWNRTRKVDYKYIQGYDFQKNYPIERLLQVPFEVKVENNVLEISIPIEKGTVKKHSNIVTDYYFEVIVVSGDCTAEQGLRIENESSDVYPIHSEREHNCRFSLPVMRKPWFVVLKVCCIEGNEMAVSPRNYGMKVIATG